MWRAGSAACRTPRAPGRWEPGSQLAPGPGAVHAAGKTAFSGGGGDPDYLGAAVPQARGEGIVPGLGLGVVGLFLA
jgi:hypothetical protein